MNILLFPMVQRYKFESKSQPGHEYAVEFNSCFQWFKDTNLKVNHNPDSEPIHDKQLFPMVQRYKFESKSQHFLAFSAFACCCFQWFKDTNLKVNHNPSNSLFCSLWVVSNGSKIQI